MNVARRTVQSGGKNDLSENGAFFQVVYTQHTVLAKARLMQKRNRF